MSLDPIATTESISRKYRAYLFTTFNLSDPDLRQQLWKSLRPDKFVKGPILQCTPPFKTGRSLQELIKEGLLSRKFEELLDRLPGPLWKHQEAAIRKVTGEKRNLVVATGTGSGKTEAFIIPILDHLFRQKEDNKLTPGIRALLLYPMNALANDQLKRMRFLLENHPYITFGRYTGETEEKQKAAEDKYRKMHKAEPLPNELVSREQMKEKPPHILLTNYAMLEYLMLRPEDHIFFDGQWANSWKFIVIDEAHTYNGAKGIEMAMLLRRLKDRVVESMPDRLRCIATSATMGRGEEDFARVAKFARKLFGESFEQQDIIRAFHKPGEAFAGPWGTPDPAIYREWRKIIDEMPSDRKAAALIETGEKRGIPNEILAKSGIEISNEYRRILYSLLKGDSRVISLRERLERGPQLLNTLSEELFRNTEAPQNDLAALVDLAVQAKPNENNRPLLPARYHLFEIAACRQCGAIFLVGETQKCEGRSFFVQPNRQYSESGKTLEYYLLFDEKTGLLPDNEDELVNLEDGAALRAEKYKICGVCGAIDRVSLATALCGCGNAGYFDIFKADTKNGNVHKCPACKRTNPKGSMVWRFLLGKDAIASVLASSLYQQIPSRGKEAGVRSEHDGSVSDDWSSTYKADEFKNEDSRRLLIFSDSRQDAAFFAPYINRTYSKILRRRLILKTIDENKSKILENKWRVQDLIPPIIQQVNRLNLFPDYSPQEKENDVWKWVLYELLDIDTRLGLEGLGCLGFALAKPDRWKAPGPLIEHPWNLSESEIWTLFQILLAGFRKKGAILFPDNVAPEDDFFQPRNRKYYFRENRSSPYKHILSSCPSAENALNARLDFLIRLANQIGRGLPRSECKNILSKIWERHLRISDSNSCWKDYFSYQSLKGEGIIYRIKHNFWELKPTSISMDFRWFYCSKCGNITLFNVRDVCPTYRCDGRLKSL